MLPLISFLSRIGKIISPLFLVYGKGGEGSPKRVEIFFSQILDNKLRNGTTIEGGGGKGKVEKLERGNYC